MRVRAIAVCLSFFSVVGCDDEPAKRPLGGTCAEPDECQSNLCVQNFCIDPIGCHEVFATGEPVGLIDVCMAGLTAVVVTPAAISAQPGDEVQFTASGTFGAASGGELTEGGGSRAGALTVTREVDLTDVATWTGDELLTFDPAEPGLAVIGRTASGRHLVRASVVGTNAVLVVFGEASIDLGAGLATDGEQPATP